MATEEYLEVVELYTVTFLSIASDEPENAISWVEKTELIEQDRQELLEKLHALQAVANEKSSTVTGAKQSAERNLSASEKGPTLATHEHAPARTMRAPNVKTNGLSKSIECPVFHDARPVPFNTSQITLIPILFGARKVWQNAYCSTKWPESIVTSSGAFYQKSA